MAVSTANRVEHWLQILTIAVVATVVVSAMVLGKVIFIPMALGIIVSFLVQPAVRASERAGLGRVPAVCLIVVLLALVLGGVTWGVAGQLRELARSLRTNQSYIANLESKIGDLRHFGGGGAMEDIQAIVDRVKSNFAKDAPAPAATTVLVQMEKESPWAAFQTTIGPLMEPLGAAAMVIVLTIFMLIGREDLRNRLISMFGYGHLSVTTRALDDAGRRIGRYLLMQFFLNAGYGIVLAVVLALINVPFALLWGFLAALLRYVPYVGPAVGAFFPVITSLVAFPGWMQPAMVVVLLVVLELTSNMIVEPLLFGQSVGISAVSLIVSAAVWTMLWGPIGLVLATPLTVCLVVLGQHVSRFRILAVLLGDEPALPPQVRYYQRLLARDRDEAVGLAQETLASAGQLATYYDQLLMPALIRVRKERFQSRISAEDEAFVLQATREIIEATTQLPLAAKRRFGRRGLTHLPTGLDGMRSNSMSVAAPTDGVSSRTILPAVEVGFRLLGCPAHHESEELVLSMLGHCIAAQGQHLHRLSTKTLPIELIEQVNEQRPDAVFLAILPPSGLVQASYLCRRLRKTFPKLPIVVGYWGNKKRFDRVLVRLRACGASFVTTSIGQSKTQLLAMADVAQASAHSKAPKVRSTKESDRAPDFNRR